LYNLIKSGIVALNGKEKRIIDSDALFDKGFRPLAFERVEEIPDGEERLEDIAVSEEDSRDQLTPEQAALLFDTDSDEAALKMLMGRQENRAGRKAEPAKKESSVQMTEKQLKEAREEAERIVSQAQEEAQNILLQAQEEAQRLTENAHENGFSQGYEEGIARAQEELLQAQNELEQQAQQLQQNYEQQVIELEPQIVDFVSELVRKITGVVLAERKDLVLHLVASCLEGAERSSSYLIHVSPEDYHDLLERKEELKKRLPDVSELRIIEDASLSKSQCMIEADTAIYDSSLDLQLERLCEDLRILSLNIEEE